MFFLKFENNILLKKSLVSKLKTSFILLFNNILYEVYILTYIKFCKSEFL